jgi:hypothetical protein
MKVGADPSCGGLWRTSRSSLLLYPRIESGAGSPPRRGRETSVLSHIEGRWAFEPFACAHYYKAPRAAVEQSKRFERHLTFRPLPRLQRARPRTFDSRLRQMQCESFISVVGSTARLRQFARGNSIAANPYRARKFARPSRFQQERASSALRLLYFRSAFYLRIRREPTLLPPAAGHAFALYRANQLRVFPRALERPMPPNRRSRRHADRSGRAPRLVRHLERLGSKPARFQADGSRIRWRTSVVLF